MDSTTITAVQWHPRKQLLAVAGYTWGPNDRFKPYIWNVQSGDTIHLSPHGARGIAWNKTGTLLAVADGYGEVYIFSEAGRLIRHFSCGDRRSLTAVAWHPTLPILVTTGSDIRVMDTTGTLLRVIDNSRQSKLVLCVQWHPSGNFFATGDYGHEGEGGEPSYLRFWNINGDSLRTVSGSRNEYRNIRWNKTGTLLATASDGLRLVSAGGNILLHRPAGKALYWGVDWNSRGEQMLVSDDRGRLLLYNVKGRLLKQLQL